MDKVIKILKKIKLRNIIILILLLVFNTYAWFIYATRVDTNLSVHVSSWDIEFISGEEEITTDIKIELDKIFPGMATFEKTIEVHNKGETKAYLSYELKSLEIMGETFVVDEENGMTSSELEEKMQNEYPFKILVNAKGTGVLEQNGSGSFNISVSWPFESGNDALDTLWGNKSYEFQEKNPNAKSIVLKLTLIAVQQN